MVAPKKVRMSPWESEWSSNKLLMSYLIIHNFVHIGFFFSVPFNPLWTRGVAFQSFHTREGCRLCFLVNPFSFQFSVSDRVVLCALFTSTLDEMCLNGLSNYDDDHNDDFKKNNRFNDQNNSSARASRSLVHFFDVHCTTTTWNLLTCRFMENENLRRRIFLPLFGPE